VSDDDLLDVGVLLDLRDRDWITAAACRGLDTALFFPERGAPVNYIRDICRSCPVAQQCLDYALRMGDHHGMWGGASERDRRAIRRGEDFTQLQRSRTGRPRKERAA